MKKIYEALFKDLVKSYYDGNFDDTVESLLKTPNFNKQEAMDLISTLCGVNIPDDANYVYNLKKAITNYEVNKRVVYKIRDCSESCGDDGIGKCQLSCPFNAILDDPIKGTKHIDENLCFDCGLCVEPVKVANS